MFAWAVILIMAIFRSGLNTLGGNVITRAARSRRRGNGGLLAESVCDFLHFFVRQVNDTMLAGYANNLNINSSGNPAGGMRPPLTDFYEW